jgi:hypothetical protein
MPWGEALPEAITKLHPELKDLVFDPEVMKEVTKTYTKVFNQQEVGAFLKGFDTIQNTWKRWLLSPFPKYHLRNVVGNLWNNYLADVSPLAYGKATAIQAYRKSGKESWLNNANITKQYADDVIKNAEELGVIGKGWYGADIPSAVEEQFIKRTALQKTGDIARMKPIIEGGQKLGTTLENNARLAHFVDKVDRGGNFVDAAVSVKKYLFVDGDLTVFE